MFGRSSDELAPALPVDGPAVTGGRSAAISILPGMALPHDLVQALPAPPVTAVGGFGPPPTVDERELVSVGAPAADSAVEAGQDAKAKRSSFSGLRRRKGEPEAPVQEAEGFFAPPPTGPALPPPTGPALPSPVGEAHVITEVHVVAEAPEPFDLQAELTAEAAAHPAPVEQPHAFAAPVSALGTLTPPAPQEAAPPAPPFVPTAEAPVAAPAPQLPVPPPFVPTAQAPVAAPVAADAVDEDPLFHHVPVHAAAPSAPAVPAAPVAPVPVHTPASTEARPSFVDRVRALIPTTGAPAAAPSAPAAVLPPPFAPPVAGGVAPPPYVPAPAAAPAMQAPPAYVPLGTPAGPPAPLAPPVGPPVQAAPDGANVAAFAHLVPTHPVGFPAEVDAMAAQVAAQVAADHTAAEQTAPVAPAAPVAPTVGLVFADGSHAELGDSADGEALQHVARVLSADHGAPASEGAAPIE